MDFIKNCSDLEKEVIKWRRDLHKIPEIGLDLPKTVAYVKNVLDEIAVEYRTDFSNDSSILVTIKGEKSNSSKCIALRADMDALPMKEETGLDIAADCDNMHACGHDGHTAMMLGAVKAINELKDKFSGTVKILFQPGEEINAGAEPMIEGGALDGVDFILGIHNGNISSLMPPGSLGIKFGPVMACMDKFTIDVYGKGCHGAYPHDSIDPITIASYIIIGIQEIVAREVNAVDSAVISVCMINAGRAFNIIPDKVEIVGTARAVTPKVREQISKRIGEVAENIAKGYRGRIEYNYSFGPPPLVNDDKISKFALDVAKRAIGEENVVTLDRPVMGGEDFAYYLEKVPGAFLFLANPLEIDGVSYPHHNVKFGLDEKYFISGVKFFTQAVFDYLGE